MERPEVVVVGGGAVGLSAAVDLARSGARVVLLEKEQGVALHQSGRNSGVIHPGFTPKPGTRKAALCVEGSRRLRSYLRAKGIPFREGGILVVARTEEERGVLSELESRAFHNGVRVVRVSSEGIEEKEPHARGVEGIWAPEGASFEPRLYVHSLLADFLNQGGEALLGVQALGVEEGPQEVKVRTSKGTIRCRALLNASGLHSDRLARHLRPDLRVVPFRGFYAELRFDRRHLVRSHVYPTPNLALPFLGVHLSRRIDGRVLVGPGAMLALGREAYSFASIDWGDVAEMVTFPGFLRMWSQNNTLPLVRSELRKSLFLEALAKEASLLVPEVRPSDLVRSFSGIRAQVVTERGEWVEDVLVLGTDRCVHVLNAVSPGLTSSLPFGEELSQEVLERLR